MAKKAKKKPVAKKIAAPKKLELNLGRWSFLVGMVLAVILGVGFSGPYAATMLWIVFMLGLVVGILNVTTDEVNSFLISGSVLVLVSYLGIQVGIFETVAPLIMNILKGILTLFVPATIIVALRSAFVLAKR